MLGDGWKGHAAAASAQAAVLDEGVLKRRVVGSDEAIWQGQAMVESLGQLRGDYTTAMQRATADYQMKDTAFRNKIAALKLPAPLISLIVGGIGVMNIMIVSVSERRHEIGLRMAIGARPLDIQLLFLVESIVLSFFGGVIGCVLGMAASYGFAASQGYAFIVSETAVLLGLVVSVIVGIFFGYYPALQASRLDPIEALRS